MAARGGAPRTEAAFGGMWWVVVVGRESGPRMRGEVGTREEGLVRVVRTARG